LGGAEPAGDGAAGEFVWDRRDADCLGGDGCGELIADLEFLIAAFDSW